LSGQVQKALEREAYMNCEACNGEIKRNGKDRKGNQRFKCLACKKTFIEPQEKPLDDMRIPIDRAMMILRLLVEGNSIRSVERITDTDKKTITSLLLLAGEKCEALMERDIRGVSVREVQCDEIWGYVGMKEKTKKRQGRNDEDDLGDAYCFVAMERNTKLVLTWHLGRRTANDTYVFTERLARATADHSFNVYTDGFRPYRDAVVYSLGAKLVNFAQLVKQYGQMVDDDHRYSPAEVIGVEKLAIYGEPELDRVCTSHIERQNLTLRMSMRRMTRLTNAFSKKWLNLRAAYALHFAFYNFCRVHKTLRVTPAIEAGITDHVWGLEELFKS
jgi:transposase-like protein/IS1 family transposase